MSPDGGNSGELSAPRLEEMKGMPTVGGTEPLSIYPLGAVSLIQGGAAEMQMQHGGGGALTGTNQPTPKPWPWGRLPATREQSSLSASRENWTLKRAIRLPGIVLRSSLPWCYRPVCLLAEFSTCRFGISETFGGTR
jgi:hypothetical protein